MSSAACAFDSEYLNALRQGDPAIETHFVDHFSPILLRTLRRKVRSAEQAREVRQETFLRVLAAVRSGHGVQKPERFQVFVFSVCNNIVREIYRQQDRCMPLSELETEPMADSPSAYDLVLAEQTRSKVRQMLSQLGGNEQGILEAMFLDEQNKDEICTRLRVSRNYLRVLLYRAKKHFSGQVEKDGLLNHGDSLLSN
jgi:RNA polymerase sigma-70 factor (ECF subfamily)